MYVYMCLFTLTIVISSTNYENIFEERDEGKRIYDQWKCTDNILRIFNSMGKSIVEYI